MTMDDLRRAFCEMAIQAVKDFDVQPEESAPEFYWYIAGGAEILRLAEKWIAEQENILENIINSGGPEPTGKYL